ncbi:hypothetical protein ACFY1U_48365 [Streptomyces sp. NPDC001351]
MSTSPTSRTALPRFVSTAPSTSPWSSEGEYLPDEFQLGLVVTDPAG